MTERRQPLHLFGRYKELLIHEGGGSRYGPKIQFSIPVISRSFSIENTMEENQKMGSRNLPKSLHIEARADVERPISHFVFIGLIPFPFFLTTPELLAIKIVCL